MGYGGALFWTGLARNLKTRRPDAQIIFTYPAGWREFFGGRQYRYKDFVVFDNNPDIAAVLPRHQWWYARWGNPQRIVRVDLRDPRYRYWTDDTPTRINYKSGKHVIQWLCDVHGIREAVLRPRIVLTTQERSRADATLVDVGVASMPFLCIEPHTKQNFTPNKAWFWERWQAVVDRLNDYAQTLPRPVAIVQVGTAGARRLRGTVDMTGKTTFRETARILERSLGLVSCLGGLVHLAKAVDKQSIVLLSGFEPPELASYPDDINLFADIDCQCRGLKTPCPIGREAMKRITVEDVVKACQPVMSRVSL